jgi:ATP-dependent helicase/nuclease subunit B
MNELLKRIADFCAGHVLAEKWLICPSRRVGHQWLETLVRQGQGLVNLRVQTPKSLALAWAGAHLAQAGATTLSARAGTILIGGILTRQRKEGYLFSLAVNQSLCQALYATIQDLRLAGLEPENLASKHMEVAAKGRELAIIMKEFKDRLKAGRWMDYPDVLHQAREALRERKGPEEFPFLLLPGDLYLSALERKLIEAVPKDRVAVLPVDRPGQLSAGREPTDAAALAWLLSPTEAPPPKQDGSASIFQAVGEANEVREVLRRCLASSLPLDDVELLYTDSQSYLPLVYELAWRLEPEPADVAQPQAPAGLKVTFAEGIPVRYSRPGRALAAWLQWIGEECPQSILVRMIQDGLLAVGQEEEFGFGRLASLLRTVPIGFGRERYLPRLDEQISALERQLRAEQKSDEEGEIDPERPARARQQLAGLKVIRSLLRQLLEITPAATAKPPAVLKAAQSLVDGLARCINELDNLARVRLAEDIANMAALLEVTGENAAIEPWDYLSGLPEGLRVGGSGPRPGCLHCAHVNSGGHSGRRHTFIVGLDDQRFPGAGLQDPVLLDAERKAVSKELPTAGADLRERLENFARLLARLRGTITLSYSGRDLVEDREAFPSPVLLAVFRILSGQRQGDQADLARWLPPPASFVPLAPAGALDAGEWWLWRACAQQPVQDPRHVVAEGFPHLGRGFMAAQKRQSEEFTEFDGRVQNFGPEDDLTAPNGPAVSPTALEALGQCPLRYFFRYILHVKPPEELEIDPARWLDAAKFGLLLHEVFCQFMRELAAAGTLPPVYDRDRPRLDELLSARIEEYRRQVPPPSEWAFRRQRWELQQAIHIFLREEEQYCKDRRPVYMEASIGLPASQDGTPLDSLEPVALAIGDGRSIRIRGRIDRVDCVGPPHGEAFAILDYKSGSSWRFHQDPPFWQGRVLQPVIYLALAAERLRQVHPKAEVVGFGYFFPNYRERGERLEYTPTALQPGLGILQRICQIVSAGAFLATDDCENDCTYCDYLAVCGDVQAVSHASKRKLQSGETALQPARELRGRHEQK